MRGPLAPLLALVPLLLLLLSCCCRCEYSIDDASLFKINFGKRPTQEELLRAKSPGTPATPDEELAPGETPRAPPLATPEAEAFADEALERVVMTSKRGEKYQCVIPKLRDAAADEAEAYAGPNALEILQNLFLTQSCAYRLEHYWTYELCHGRHVRQFHEEREGKDSVKLTEYYLGKYDADRFKAEVEELKADAAQEGGAARKPQKMRIETLNMPFYELVMDGGTVCDLNGRPRVTRVNYVCYPAGKHEMYSFKESSTCEYDIVVLSPTLCNHPDYRPEESHESVVHCRPMDEQSPYKPEDLVRLEAESVRLRSEKMFEGNFMQGDTPGSVRIEIKQVRPGEEGVEEDMDDDDVADRFKAKNWPTGSAGDHRQPFKPLMDPQIVKEFLAGEYCLYGGSGWWKYEFCYGKKVDQYHEEKDGKRTTINLGRFDESAHKGWVAKNPGKKPRPTNSRKHVSHFYSGGDVCDVTKKPRSVEVKLKCKRSDSPSAVSLYLLEPSTCEYILGVESPLVCDILHTADPETGMMTIDKELLDK